MEALRRKLFRIVATKCEVGERFDPYTTSFNELDGAFTFNYLFATRFVTPKSMVLDAGCGYGYGAARVAELAGLVVGLDISRKAVAARSRSRLKNMEFLVADSTHMPFRDAAFNLVLAFELIEHLTSPCLFFSEGRRILAPGGKVILSTPNAGPSATKRTPINPFHLHEFTYDELKDALSRQFERVTIFGKFASATYHVQRNSVSQVLARFYFALFQTPWCPLLLLLVPRGIKHVLQRAIPRLPADAYRAVSGQTDMPNLLAYAEVV